MHFVVVIPKVECVSQAADRRTDWFYNPAYICYRQKHNSDGQIPKNNIQILRIWLYSTFYHFNL